MAQRKKVRPDGTEITFDALTCSYPALLVKESTIPEIGGGLFARQAISKGDYLLYYGEKLNRAEKRALESITYVVGITDDLFIDANPDLYDPFYNSLGYPIAHRGQSIGAYVNTDKNRCNLQMVVYAAGQTVKFVAAKDIEEGEELFLSTYGSSYRHPKPDERDQFLHLSKRARPFFTITAPAHTQLGTISILDTLKTETAFLKWGRKRDTTGATKAGVSRTHPREVCSRVHLPRNTFIQVVGIFKACDADDEDFYPCVFRITPTLAIKMREPHDPPLAVVSQDAASAIAYIRQMKDESLCNLRRVCYVNDDGIPYLYLVTTEDVPAFTNLRVPRETGAVL